MQFFNIDISAAGRSRVIGALLFFIFSLKNKAISMVETQCAAGPVKTYIMSDLLKKLDLDAASDLVKALVAVVGFYAGLFYRTSFFFLYFLVVTLLFNFNSPNRYLLSTFFSYYF